MSHLNEVLYIDAESGLGPRQLHLAMCAVSAAYEQIRETDSELPRPIVPRNLQAVAVALHPTDAEKQSNHVLAVAQLGWITPRETRNEMALKATARAFKQWVDTDNRAPTDTAPAERVIWFDARKPQNVSNASVNGLAVGFAGVWPHHGRLMSIAFAASLSESLGLDTIEPSNQKLLSDEAAAERLEWFNRPQFCTDNTYEDRIARDRPDIHGVLDLIATYRDNNLTSLSGIAICSADASFGITAF